MCFILTAVLHAVSVLSFCVSFYFSAKTPSTPLEGQQEEGALAHPSGQGCVSSGRPGAPPICTAWTSSRVSRCTALTDIQSLLLPFLLFFCV